MRYDPPVSALLTRGEVRFEQSGWPDYAAAYGFDTTHVPELIRMATDPELNSLAHDPEVWAPVHAWRALGQLRATEAIEPLIGLFDLIESDDFVPETAEALAMIGPDALPPLARHLADTARPLYSRTLAAEAIGKVGSRHPSARDDAVVTLTRHLEQFESHDPELNAFLVSALLDLGATEPDAVAVMEAAYTADSVDESICGDWEDVRIGLGLLPERLTPKPRPLFDRLVARAGASEEAADFLPPPPQMGRTRKEKAKAKARHKMAKESRRRNRRRR